MVARSPLKVKKMVAPINPLLLRETLIKVDRCMSRLQELQNTVTGGSKVVCGVNLSPRSSRGYMRTSLRCKQESLRIKNATPNKSPVGKFRTNTNTNTKTGGDWRRMSLPAMLLGETVGEIIEAGHFAKEIVEAAHPTTPLTVTKTRNRPDNTELRTRRKREKLHKNNTLALAYSSSPRKLERVRSRINFKKTECCEKENNMIANRVSPKLKPWAKKAVLFPNPLFLTTPSKAAQPQTQKFCKTRSPVKRETPHKFLIKSPPKILIKSPPKAVRPKSSPAVVSKLRRSFSPSRLASRLVSPLKSRKSSGVGDGLVMMSGLKQRPLLVPIRHSFAAAATRN